MKKILIGLAAVLILVSAAVIVVPMLIPLETYKEQVRAQVREATGRDLTIAGDIRLSLFPNVQVELRDVAFSNAEGASRANMATLESLKLDVPLMPLFSGELRVDEFVLVKPDILLEVDEQGRPNWVFQDPAPSADPSPATAPAERARGAGHLDRVRLGDIRIEDGRLTYVDRGTGTTETFDSIDVRLALPDLDSRMKAEGNLTWNRERVGIDVDLARPRVMLEGGESSFEIGIKADPIALAFGGTLTMTDAPGVAGMIDLDVPSVRRLAAWAGSPIEVDGDILGPFAVKGEVTAGGTAVALRKAAIRFDAIEAVGSFEANVGGAVPHLKGELAVDRLDLNPYLSGEAATPAPTDQPATTAASPADEGWSTDPIDMSGLNAANVDFDLTVGSLRVQEIEVGESALQIRLAGGKLNADLTQLALYEGEGSGRLSVDASGQVPTVASRFDLKGLAAEPFLAAAAGFERLEGTGALAFEVTTRGASQKAMVEALGGNGAFSFTDGAIKGINLAAMVRNVQGAFLDRTAREAQKTDFSELSGTFTIDKGIVTNRDLALMAPLLRLAGAGTVNMPDRTLDYRIEPRAAATIEGQGGREEVAGILVPVIVQGPWNDLSYRPDLTALIQQDPRATVEGARRAVDQLREGGTDALRGIIGGGQEQQGEQQGEQQPAEDPVQQLRGLFGR